MAGTEPKWTFAQKFCADFAVTASALASRLDALKGSANVPQATLQNISSDLSRLTKSLGDATGSLPSYDQRQCELQLKTLEKTIEELRGASANTPKFAFKRKATKLKTSTELSSAKTVSPPLDQRQSTAINAARTLASFSHRYLTHLDVSHPESSAEVSISDLDSCIVNLLSRDKDRPEINALHVQRVFKSILLLPRIAGSIILHDLSECIIVVGCHQFRMHNSMAVDVFLEIISDPIIEHCSDVRFAGYPSSLTTKSSLQDSRHFGVKDFSHILSTPSPNWSRLPEENTEKTWPLSPLEDQGLRQELRALLPARHATPTAQVL